LKRARRAEALAKAGSNVNLISKVYFPRLIVPASAVIVSFVDFTIINGVARLSRVIAHHPGSKRVSSGSGRSASPKRLSFLEACKAKALSES
jgi:hypothetical protein